jgi:hypothetical protein
VNFTKDLFKGDLFFEEVLDWLHNESSKEIFKKKRIKRGPQSNTNSRCDYKKKRRSWRLSKEKKKRNLRK